MLYIFLIFLTAPLLPYLVQALADCLGWSLVRLTNCIKVFVLAGLALGLPLYLYRSGRHRQGRCWLVLALTAVAAGWLAANFGSPVEATHLLEYGGLSIVLFYTMARSSRKSYKILYLQAALSTLLIGVLDELYQGILPNRYYDFNDILTNTFSGLLGLFFLWGVVRPRRQEDTAPGNGGAG